jgi:plastocyanin
MNFKLVMLILFSCSFVLFLNLIDINNNHVFAETFQITIPLGATTSNIDEPFVPSTINIPINSSVKWTNKDSTLHTVTSINETLSKSNLFDSGLFSQGERFTVNYNKTGSYPYQCILHPFMTGNVIVVAESNISSTETAETANQLSASATDNNNNNNIKQPKEQILIEENPITLTAVEVNGVYVWENNGKNNPTLNLLAEKQYDFIIKSLPSDSAEHEFKIVLPNGEEEGEEIIEAEEVEEGEQTQVSFTPIATKTVDTLKYYCEYHPQSMVGIINIVSN